MIRKGYRIEGDEKKRVIARKKGFRTKKEALESLPTLFSKKEREKNPTFRAIYEQWLPTHRAGKDTMNCYKAAMKYFREIEFFRLAEIDELAAGRTSGALFYNREDVRAFRIDKFRDQVYFTPHLKQSASKIRLTTHGINTRRIVVAIHSQHR